MHESIAMKNRKSKARRAKKDELQFIGEGDGAELFIACYITAARVWRQEAHAVLAKLPSQGLPLASEPAMTRREIIRLIENFAKAKLEAAELLRAAMNTDGPGGVAMLDLTKLGIAIEAYGRMNDAYEIGDAFYRGTAKPDGLAGMAPWGNA